MKSSTSSNEIETPIDIFNQFLFLSLLGCQHISLSRAEAGIAVSECVEKLFEKNLFHASIFPHVFALMQNQDLLSQSFSQSLSRVDSFLATAGLSWHAGLWADSRLYGRPPAEIAIQLCFHGQQKNLRRNSNLKTIRSIELSFWKQLVQINTRCLDTPFKVFSDKAGVNRLDHPHLLGQRVVRQAAQKIYDPRSPLNSLNSLNRRAPRSPRNSEKKQNTTHTQQGWPSPVFGLRPLDFLAQAYPPAPQSGESSIFSKRDFLFENGFFVRRSDIQDLLSKEEIITERNNKNKNSSVFYVTGSENRRYYPSFFADDRYDLDVIQAVSKQLGSISGAEKWLFFVSPRVSLGGMTPLEVIEKTRSGNKNNIETDEGFRVGLSDVMSGAKSTAEA